MIGQMVTTLFLELAKLDPFALRADIGLGAVDKNFRGKGIGRIIFENVEKWSCDNRYIG